MPGPWTGQLAIIPRPRGGEWLRDELAGLEAAGISVMVSLLESQEASEFLLDDEALVAAAVGIHFISIPVPDQGVPHSLDEAIEAVRGLLHILHGGEAMALHCRQSIGRSGLLAISLLVAAGLTVDEAITTASAARGLELPETQVQASWLRQFAEAYANR